jgi:hypothetical protein
MIKSKTVLGLIMMGIGAGALADDPQPPAAPPAAPAAATPATASPEASLTATNAMGPRIEFSTNVYEFGRVKAGDPIKYTYYFTNTGNALLEVTDVRPSCGCTTAGEWTKKVEPGATGFIPIQFNSANYSGSVFKTITVSANDKQKPSTVLQLKGTIWKPIELAPAYTVLTIPPDAPSASTVVRIINNMDQPLDVFSPEVSNHSFDAELKTNQPGKEFSLTIKTVPPLTSGNAQGKVVLKTSATNTPLLEVPFWANVQPALMVIPQQITLPQAPLATKSTPSLTIQNNSTNAVTLSEASINVKDVDVQLKEIQPGRVFNALITFPEGFEIPKGQQVVFTAKTTNPQFPLVKVPVNQLPRPAAVQQPPAPNQPSAAIVPPPTPAPQAAR